MAKNQNKPKYQQVQKPAAKPAAPKKDLIQSPKDKWFWPAIAALGVIVFITFMSAMGNSFVDWDDHVYVYENPLILNPTSESFSTLGHQVVSLNYHPVTMWSLWLNASMSGTDSASAFIGTNILFHILNVLLVFVIFYRLTGRQLTVAFITALLFGVHPLRVESVVWVSERKDVLYVFFFLLACLSWMKYGTTTKKRWYAITLLLFILSCLSKAQAVVLPIVLILLDYWKDKKLSAKIFLDKVPFLAVALLFGMIALNVQSGGDFHGLLTLPGKKTKALASADIFSMGERMQFGGYGYMMYWVKSIAPVGLCTFYPYPLKSGMSNIMYILGPLFMLGTLGLSVFAMRKTRLFAFGTGWYLATVALVLQFISVGVVIMADRYSYLPSVGLFFMLAYGIESLLADKEQAKKIWWGAAGAFAILCIVMTMQQIKTWKDSETLWGRVIELYPTEDQPRETLANWYGKQFSKTNDLTYIDKAMAQLNKAAEDGTDRSDVYGALANCYGIKSQAEKDAAKRQEYFQKGTEAYSNAIKIKPDEGDYYYNRALMTNLVSPAAAVEDLNKALQLMPYKEAQIKGLRSIPLINLKRYQEGVDDCSAVIKITEALPAALKTPQTQEQLCTSYRNRGIARYNLNDKAGAIADLQKALTINPNDANARNVLNQIGAQ